MADDVTIIEEILCDIVIFRIPAILTVLVHMERRVTDVQGTLQMSIRGSY
jgi:hypothetical protein